MRFASNSKSKPFYKSKQRFRAQDDCDRGFRPGHDEALPDLKRNGDGVILVSNGALGVVAPNVDQWRSGTPGADGDAVDPAVIAAKHWELYQARGETRAAVK